MRPDQMLRDFLTADSLHVLAREVISDFGPSISVLVSVLGLGAWLLGIQVMIAEERVIDAAGLIASF